MNIDDQLRAVVTIGDLELVLHKVGKEKPRSIDFNTLMREQFEADRLVAEHFPGMNTVKVISQFGTLHRFASDTVEAVNLGTHPQLVLALARIVMSGR